MPMRCRSADASSPSRHGRCPPVGRSSPSSISPRSGGSRRSAAISWRTPRTVIGGFTETMLDDSLPNEQRQQFARTVFANTQRMQRIVDDLLDLSRIESGGWKPNPARVDVGALASEALAAAGERRPDKPVTLDLDIAPDATAVWADPTALRQMLTNLVD